MTAVRRISGHQPCLALLAILVFLHGCGGNSSDGGGAGDGDATSTIPVVVPTPGSTWLQPALDTTWQWQIQGIINVGYDVQLYDIDLFDSPASSIDDLHAAGKLVICYFSAGSYESFRSDATNFLPDDLGKTLSGFADEKWLDIRSANVHEIMRERLDLAAQKGCDGVEPDNVDGYTNNPGFNFNANDQLAYNRLLAIEAHNRGLAVGLKNDLDQVTTLIDNFDFSVNEQCNEFNECDLLQPFIAAGKPVFNAEYANKYVNDPARRMQLCNVTQSQSLHTLVLPLDLDDSFRFSCDP